MDVDLECFGLTVGKSDIFVFVDVYLLERRKKK